MAYQIADLNESFPCWHCGQNAKMYFQTFQTCFGQTLEYYECCQCRFTLDISYVREHGTQPYNHNGTAA